MTSNWWKGATIYQIYPRSFCDANGDGIGDLKGITDKLDYVASLNVDGVWISPFFTSPMKDYGYDVANYCDVDPMLGTLADFDALVAKTHELGLKVVIDMVLSHSSDQHAWFTESCASRDNAKADWYVWADAKSDGGPPNNWLSVFGGGAWEWEPRRRQYYLHNFLKEQPDLNFWCDAVQDALLNQCRFWLERGVDGFRLDVCNYYFHDKDLRDNPPKPLDDPSRHGGNPYAMQTHEFDKSRPETIDFHKRLRALTDAFDARFIVGEVGDDDPLTIMDAYTNGPGPLHTCYSFAFLRPGIKANQIGPAVEGFQSRSENGWPSWSFSNHDVIRARTRWGGVEASNELAVAINALLLSLPGTIFLYQGEELGLPEADLAFEDLRDPVGLTFYPDNKGRDGCRTPMPWEKDKQHGGFSRAQPWLPVPLEHQDLAVDAQEDDPHSALHRTRALVAWRQKTPSLLGGSIGFVASPAGTVFGWRELDGDKIYFAVNTLANPCVLALPDRLEHLPGSPSHATAFPGGSPNELSLGPFGFGFLGPK